MKKMVRTRRQNGRMCRPKKSGDGEAEDGECRDGEAAGENLGEQDAGSRAEEDAQAGFARLGGWHGVFFNRRLTQIFKERLDGILLKSAWPRPIVVQ